MSSANSNNYAVCNQMCELIDQIEDTIRPRLLLGDLVQIRNVNLSHSNRCIIQLFDRETQCFGRDLYQCDKENLCEISSNMWPFIHGITEGSVVKVRMVLAGEQVTATFQVKYFGKIPSLGHDQFYGLQIMPNSNLTKENIMELNKIYLSPTLNLIILRADNLILNLVVNIANDEPKLISPNTNRVEKTIYITNPDESAINFQLVLVGDNKLKPNVISCKPQPKTTQSLEQTIIPDAIRKKINIRTSDITDENSSTDLILPNMKQFVLPKIAHSEHSNMNNLSETAIQFRLVPVIDDKLNVNVYKPQPNTSESLEQKIIPDAIRKKINIRTSDIFDENSSTDSMLSKMKQFVLPKVANNEHNSSMTIKVQKNRRPNKQRHRECKRSCFGCGKSNEALIQFDCQHIFCSKCLIKSLIDQNLEDSCCPYKNRNYNCRYRLTVDDIQHILDTVNGKLIEKDDTSKIKSVFHKCIGCQFIAKTDERAVYQCTNCKIRNAENTQNHNYFEHDETPSRFPPQKTVPSLSSVKTWTCTYCTYGENRVDTNKCVICSKTNDRLVELKENDTFIPIWNGANSQDHKYIEHDETPSRKPTSKPVPSLSSVKTWTCTSCTYSENRIDTNQCVICYKINDKLVRKSNATEYYRLLELEENDTFIPNFHQFFCTFCDQTIAPENGVQLRSCLHNVCRNCIVTYIERQNQVDIKCPYDLCPRLLEYREIKTLISPVAYAKYLEKSFNIGKMKIENGYQCCMPDCKGFWVYDNATSKYNCPKCNIENCIACKASHPGINCTVFKAQQK